VLHALQRLDRVGDPAGHLTGDGAARCGQRHDDVDRVILGDVDRVDEPQVEDIHRDFRIIDRAAGLHDAVVERCSVLEGRISGAPSIISGVWDMGLKTFACWRLRLISDRIYKDCARPGKGSPLD
jgi:hypothetical protein